MKLSVAILLLTMTASAHATEPATFEDVVQPFFKTYCVRCHDMKTPKGEFRLDTLARDFANEQTAQKWAELLVRVNGREMPPKAEPQPKADELARVVEWITARVKEGEAARMAKRGPVTLYRLSREEYGNTVQDLLGVYFDVNQPGAFNEDPRWHGFDRIGSLLSLSPSHVDRYFKAAEVIVDQAFPLKEPKSTTVRKAADDGKWQPQGHAGPVRWLLWPGHGTGLTTIKNAGRYRIRIQLSATPSFRGRVPHLALWHSGMKRAIFGQDVLAPEDKPTTLAIETFLPEGVYTLQNVSPGTFSDSHTLSNTKFTFRSVKATPQEKPTGYQLFREDGTTLYPTLMVDWVELEGPIVHDSDRKLREGLIPAKEDIAEARACLTRFASRAWRRPVTEAEVERYIRVLQSEVAGGEKFPLAYRTALVGILTSKNFYYLEEGSSAQRRERINDWELASRLSYFLWNSRPDDTLLAAARDGTLTKPEVLREQLHRLLGDAKMDRFTQSFPRQWLQLHRVGQFPPDPELYPDYDKWLEESMVQESTRYFETMVKENLPLPEFLNSNWTVLNSRLAIHYGLTPLSSTEYQKVKLPAGSHRGGLLTQASILSLTSDGTRHRPVHRGVWVSEAVFARTPPPPPPNVEPLEPTPSDKPKATIRQQLHAHSTHATCAACHQKIDPLGFAFDNFDALGRWRTHESVSGGQGDDPPVDAAGTLPSGSRFNGPDDFKRLLADDVDRFAEAFVEQLATYALRRVMTIDDEPHIKSITAASKKDGYRLRNVLENLVTSDLFQKR
jgi:hypothetical protein